MASLKDMRVRIAATKATQKITKAMQMVAASKLRRAQTAAEAARPYAERMSTVLGSIASAVAGSDSAPKLLAGTGKDQVHLLVVCTAERGLCGPFNSSIVRLARERANALAGQSKDVKILCVGRKGADQLRRQYGKLIIETVELRGVKQMGFEQAEMISKKIVALFEPAKETGPSAAYEYEPDEEDILAELLPRNLSVQVFRALLENAASEQGARMSAMDNATRNAGEMIRKQTLTYNRTRQAMITKELIEIISGAEAV